MPLLVAIIAGFALSVPDCVAELGWVLCNLFGVSGKAELIGVVGWLLAGSLSASAVIVAGLRTRAMEDTVREQARAVEATEARQRQERFRDAISHLGHEKATVRQGGAHTLFHLALEDPTRRATIAEVLGAHLREMTTQEQEKQSNTPSTEVQSLMCLLFTKHPQNEEKVDNEPDTLWEGITPNLSGMYLRGLKLPEARLRGANLDHADLKGAALDQADLQDANLFGAQLQGTILGGANLQGAKLDSASFQDANLSGASLQDAKLYSANFQDANLSGANLQDTDLVGANFQGADLSEANFQGANLWGANFQDATFDGANFQDATFDKASFQDAKRGGANLQGAKCGGTNL